MRIHTCTKGQATLFVLLGIVLIIVFSFAIHARGVIVGNQLQAQAQQAVEDYLQANSITYYVEGCLERVSLDVMRRTALQGGNVSLTGEHGTHHLNFTYEDRNYSSLYGLTPNTNQALVYPEPPEYPWPNTSISNLMYGGSVILDGFYGRQTLIKLCERGGLNDYLYTDLGFRCNADHFQGTLQPANITLQHYMAQEATEQLLACVDWSLYEDLGHEIQLNEEDVRVDIIYGKDQVSFIATYPFSVNVGGRRSVLTYKEFTMNKPLRFKLLYEYVSELLAREARNINFNLSEEYNTTPTYDSGFVVELLSNPRNQTLASCTSDEERCFDDVLIVKDLMSLIDGAPLTWMSAIRNRIPVLDYMNSGSNSFDVQVMEGRNLTLNPVGYDPDDESVTYSYKGWREDYDTYFNYSCVEANHGDDSPGPENNYYENCVVQRDEFVETRKWTNSTLWFDTHQNASIEINRSDAGLRVVNISVFGQGGLYDYQLVRILIFDLPVAVARGNSTFNNVNWNITSTEDPYVLDARESRASVMMDEELQGFRWNITRGEEVVFEGTTEQRISILPNTFLTAPFSWLNMPLLPLNKTLLATPPTGVEVNVTLVVGGGEMMSAPDTFLLNVFACIPYRNRTPENMISSYSYPYNNTNYNSFDHTCCEGGIGVDGTLTSASILAGGTSCFSDTRYGSLSGLAADLVLSTYGNPEVAAPNRVQTFSDGAWEQSYINPIGIDNYANDIFIRTLNRYCDGTQGNACTGPIHEVFMLADECDDFPLDRQAQDERCFGPAITGTSTTTLSCVAYSPGQTFELVFNYPQRGGGTADGVCDPTYRCTNGNGGVYDYFYNGAPTMYRSQAQCGEGGCSIAANPENCDLQTRYSCEGAPMTLRRYDNRCTPAANHECQEQPAVNHWTVSPAGRCAQPQQLGSMYCGVVGNVNNPASLTACGPNECCDANAPNNQNPCNDPCSLVNDACIQTRNCAGGAGGTCTILPSSTNCIQQGTQGFCDSTYGVPHKCRPLLAQGASCTSANMCLSGVCSGGLCS